MPKPSPSDLFTPAPLPVAPLSDAERLACLRMIRSTQIGDVTFRKLINLHGGAAAALEALPEMARRAGRAMTVCSEVDALRELEAAQRLGARLLFTIEPGYPGALAVIDAPPPLVYVQGNTDLLARPAIAIVGSRQASAAGLKLARLFAGELGASGLVVVSGLARGIDAAAHEASLAHGTVAAIAGGIGVVYPPEHADLQARIAADGCLLTDRPPGFIARAKDFPRRNRLISGLSLGVLVVEAAHRSGTLVTARYAGEQGRDVFALPGNPLDPRAEGTNQLLKSGATIVTEPNDILDALAPQLRGHRAGLSEPAHSGITVPPRAHSLRPSEAEVPHGDDQARARLLDALGPHPVDIDELMRSTGLCAGDIRGLLMELDLSGEIVRHGFQLVSRAVDDD